MDQDNSQEEYQEVKKSKNKHPLFAFIPKGHYFFTPIILDINILVFVLMIISGVSPVLPTAESLIGWGANYRKLTMGGEPWRLFTAMFLHFGIIHLASNMYAFFSLGRMLEPFIGKWRFLWLYLFAGLGGSAVSLWWHANDPSVSAGASGAIFGLFGVFAALLTTDLIDQSIRKQLLKSMGSAILLNLLIGLYGGIDNSAHIGGLLTGAAGGYLCYNDLQDWYRRRILKYRGIILTGILTAVTIVVCWMIIPKQMPADNEALLKRFDSNEDKALTYWGNIDSTITQEAFHTNFYKPWEENLVIIDSLNPKGLKEEFTDQIPALRKYVLWRLEAAKYYERSIKEKRIDFRDSSNALMNKAGQTISDITLKLNGVEK